MSYFAAVRVVMLGKNAQERFASVQFSCPRCDGEHHLQGGPGGARVSVKVHDSCPGCQFGFDTSLENCTPEKPVNKCAICASEEFYIVKDFNRQLGLMIAVGSLMAIFLVMLLVSHLAGLYCLFGLGAVDGLIFWRWKNVTVCYLCHAIYRGSPQNADHTGFYLGNEEKFKHLRSDWIERVVKQK